MSMRDRKFETWTDIFLKKQNSRSDYQISLFSDFDEDELEAELNELEMEGDMEEQQKLEAELLDVGVTDDLPEIPQTEPAVAKPAAAPQKKKKAEEEDPDMAELAAWAS